jgi:hypothetical protein
MKNSVIFNKETGVYELGYPSSFQIEVPEIQPTVEKGCLVALLKREVSGTGQYHLAPVTARGIVLSSQTPKEYLVAEYMLADIQETSNSTYLVALQQSGDFRIKIDMPSILIGVGEQIVPGTKLFLGIEKQICTTDWITENVDIDYDRGAVQLIGKVLSVNIDGSIDIILNIREGLYEDGVNIIE